MWSKAQEHLLKEPKSLKSYYITDNVNMMPKQLDSLLFELDKDTVIKLENHFIQPSSRNTKDFQIKPNFWLKYLYFTWANQYISIFWIAPLYCRPHFYVTQADVSASVFLHFDQASTVFMYPIYPSVLLICHTFSPIKKK